MFMTKRGVSDRCTVRTDELTEPVNTNAGENIVISLVIIHRISRSFKDEPKVAIMLVTNRN